MSLPLERSFEVYEEHHIPLLAHAAMMGTNITQAPWSERFIGYGDTENGFGAACILDIIETPQLLEPHIIWFPWTTARNRIENFMWGLEHLSKINELFFSVQKDQISLFEHFTKKGLFRKVGYLTNMKDIEEIHMYQYNRRTE